MVNNSVAVCFSVHTFPVPGLRTSDLPSAPVTMSWRLWACLRVSERLTVMEIREMMMMHAA